MRPAAPTRVRSLLTRLSLSLVVVGLALGPLGLASAPARADDKGEAPKPAEPAPPPRAEPAPAEPTAGEPAPAAPAPKADDPKGPSKPAKKRRGGINPCMTPDPGFGIYDTWSNAPSSGQMIAPQRGGLTKDGGFDLVVHFHGHEPTRKEFVKTAKGIVFVGIDLGIGSGAYQQGFASPNTFTQLLASVEKEMARRSGNPKAHVRKLALSSWSAGYGAIGEILRQPAGKKVDALILLDSLHAGYENEQTKTLKTLGLEPFTTFAKQAAAGRKLMYLSHSSIIPPGYASTTEVAHFLEASLKGKPKKTTRQDVLGLDMFERFDKGGFHVRGYTGNDKPDHCAHIGLMADVVKSHLGARWGSPKGFALKADKKGDKPKGDATKVAKKSDGDAKKGDAKKGDAKKGDAKKGEGGKAKKKADDKVKPARDDKARASRTGKASPKR